VIQTRVHQFGYATAPDWNLNTGSGMRRWHSPDIKFQPPFTNPPTIALALSGIEGEQTTSLRVHLDTLDVEADEFNIVISTWDDSVVRQVWVTWIAYD
jgi:hypothetical protein